MPPAQRSTSPAPGSVASGPDQAVDRDLVAFALDPSPATAGKLPFAEEVRIGLGRDLTTVMDRSDLSDRAAWTIDAENFRAHVGPLNALDLLRHQALETNASVASGEAFQVSLGEHPHCVAPPVRSPRGFEHHRRVSLQPAESALDSCLSWFTVDLFMNQAGTIEAVTLDVWEP